MGKKRIITKGAEESLVVESKDKASLDTASVKRGAQRASVHIQATYNNTIIALTDERGAVLALSSSGAAGFKGTKKSTPFAASKVAEIISEKAKKVGISELNIFVKGIGSGRESAIRALANKGFIINQIRDITPVPHNGPKPPKVRRV